MQFQENTAYYRASARQAAIECNWKLAAQQMAKAIEVYPGNGGALAQRDLQQMRDKLASYRQFAIECAPAEDLTPEGIQLVIPGAERTQPPSRAQMELF